MKNTKIVPCGMARRYNEESGAWGECVELVNMRERNESLEVVGRWNELADVASGERILLADRRADAEYYFSAKGIKVNIHGMLKNGTYSVMNKTVCVTQGDVLWLKSIGDFVVIGTSLVVYPAASLINFVGRDVPIFYIDPNPAPVPKNSNVTVIAKTASEGMKELAEILKNMK